MDDQRFDAFSRALAQSRRSLFAFSLAAAGSALGISLAEAGKKKKKKHKKKKDDCLETACVDPDSVCNPGGSPCCDCYVCSYDGEEYRCRADS
ncbi:MAG: hypothetical protein U0075_25635 [Thermomicrobiales bacterium]